MTSIAQHISDIKSGKSNIKDQLNIYISKASNSKLNSWLKVLEFTGHEAAESDNLANIYDFDELANKPLAGAPI